MRRISLTSGPIVVQIYSLHRLDAEVMALKLAAKGIETQILREGQGYARLEGTPERSNIVAQIHTHRRR